MPHGNPGSGPGVATAMANNSFALPSTAAATAFLSAHTHKPYEAFSTLAPVNTRFGSEAVRVNSTAPTVYPEYGAYARVRIASALRARAAQSIRVRGDGRSRTLLLLMATYEPPLELGFDATTEAV